MSISFMVDQNPQPPKFIEGIVKHVSAVSGVQYRVFTQQQKEIINFWNVDASSAVFSVILDKKSRILLYTMSNPDGIVVQYIVPVLQLSTFAVYSAWKDINDHLNWYAQNCQQKLDTEIQHLEKCYDTPFKP
jgi:hypothetical protein